MPKREVVKVALTAKQERFVAEYLIDLNATQAAIRAGYSQKAAESIGYENLRKPQIAKEIALKQEELQSKLEITQEKVLFELAKIGFANITDFLEYKTMLRKVGEEDGEPTYDWAISVIAKDSEDIDGSAIQEVSVSKDGTFKFKLYDKLSALDKIGRHLGMFEATAKNKPVEENNLLEAIAGNIDEGVDIDDIPEIEQTSEDSNDVVEDKPI